MPSSSSSLFRITSLLRPFSEPRSSSTVATSGFVAGGAEEFTHISRRPDSSSFVPVTTSSSPTPPKGDPQNRTQPSAYDILTPTPSNVGVDHTYPPSTSASTAGLESPPSLPHRPSTITWLKASKPRVLSFGSNTSEAIQVAPPGGKVREMYSSTSGSTGTGSRWSGVGDLAYSVLENPGNPVDDDTVERFRAAFAYDEKETLLGYFPGYIFRLLPVYGRLYISTNYFCFKSTGPLAARTRMTLPIRDILSVELSKDTRFGHHGG
ncbi:hypothetical protein MPER_08897, partial [Moniliophthora perniciosa FA553]